MFNGTGRSKVDQKSRVKVPKKILEQVRSNSASQSFFVTRGNDRCLFLVTQERWREISEKRRLAPPQGRKAILFDRFFFGLGERVETDASDRFVIPEPLRQWLGETEEVVFLGARNRVEIWSAESWDAFMNTHEQEFEEYLDGMTE